MKKNEVAQETSKKVEVFSLFISNGRIHEDKRNKFYSKSLIYGK